ncbi:MAG: S-layer protein, partial [Candidatus Nanohaloarchaea archaeon]
MQRIKKISKTVGTALLAGATLTGAAAAADLGDYPNQFIDDDGTVDANIVVGQSAKTVDVVGAIDIAGSLSQSATTEETVSTGNSGGEWTSSGTTLDTRNDNLYFLDSLDTVRQTLTQEQLSALEENTFRDDSGDETSIEYFLYPGSQQVTFGKPDDRSNKDPVLYVNNPSSPSSSSHLFQLQANFEDGINFTAGDVQDEDIQLFGKDYTVSTDTTSNELVLYGSQQTVSVDSGSSTTLTINGEEHTIEVVAVTSSNTAAFRIDGQLREKDEDETFTVDGQEVRVTDVIQTNADSSQGTVSFGIGSEEIRLQNGQQIEDGDGNDIDGTMVQFQGTDSGSNGVVDELSGIDIYVGSDNDDHEYVMAGESYSHPMFENFEFHFGGLNPDAGQGASGSVGETKVSTAGDDTISATISSGGSTASVDFIHETSPGDSNENLALQDDSGDKIVAVEGDAVSEDEYVMADAGDFSHMWQINNVDVDTTDLTANGASGDEATVQLKDVITGDSVEIDMDANGDGAGVNNDDVYEGTEVIDGQTYHATLATKDSSSTSDDDLTLTWGTDADFGTTGKSGSGVTTAFPTIETDTGARVGFYEPSQDPSDFGTNLIAFNTDEKFYDAKANTPAGTNGFSDGDDIVRDIGGSGTYSASADTSLNTGNDGTADSSNGATLNALSGITGSTYYLISGDTTVSSGEDVVNDNDGDGVYTANQDTFYDTDGTSTNAAGSSQDSAGAGLAGAETVSTAAGGTPGGSGAIYFVDTDGSTAGSYQSSDEIFLDPNIASAGNLELDLDAAVDNDNDGTAGDDSVIYDGGDAAVDTTENTTMTQFASGDGVDFADGGANTGSYDDGEDIVTDAGGSGTLSLNPDSTVNANGDGVSASNGAAMVDLSTASGGQWVDIDTNGYDAGDEIFSDDDSDGVYTSQGDTLVSNTDGTTDVSAGNSLTAFASSTKHDESQSSNGQFDSGENVVDDSGSSSGSFDSGDTVLLGSLTGSGNLQYWSSDAEETNAVSGLQSMLPSSEPAFVFIEEEAEDDTQYSYTVTGNWDSGDSEVTVASPSFSDSSKRQTRQMESDDDLTTGYDVWGTHTVYDSDGQHSFTLHYPAGQASAGAAFTAMDGSLSSSGSAGSVTTQVPAGWPDVARLDSEVSSPSTSTILVGGPVVNSLVKTLADQGMTQAASEYSSGEAIVQYIEDAWSSG